MLTTRDNFDTLLLGGLVVDGTGAEPRRADVGVRDGVIADIGDLANATAARILDCAGYVVAPGFIDTHSHSDTYILLRPDAPSKIRQGVTTEIVGQCGASATPLGGRAKLPSDWAAFDYPAPWQSLAEYREILRSVDPLMNIVCMTGHRNLRMAVMGPDARVAESGEIRAMRDLLRRELEQGSAGLTTGLLYQPACHAGTDEIRELAAECAAAGAHYATHLRSEGAALIPAIDEAIDIARTANVPLQISHFKTAGAANHRLLDEAIAHIEAARADGIRVCADRYPYTASATDLDVILPEWAERGTHADILARLADSATRRRIADEMMAQRAPNYWAGVMIGATVSEQNRAYRGRFVSDIADELDCVPAEAVLRIVEADGLRTGGIFFAMSETNLRRIYALPWVMVGSDASIRATEGVLSHDHPHPRAFGTFPRFLAMCRDENLMPLQEAVRRITSLPADTFRLARRGRLQRGFVADITVFDAHTVRDTATFAEPHRYPVGIAHVMCAGRIGFSEP